MIHKIYGAQIGALVNNAVEDGEEDVGSRHVFSLTRVLVHLEAQTEILLGGREKLILYAIAASMHEIPSFLSISATLLNEKFVLPERMRLTY
mgnify:CR=1 FL=1